MGVYIKGMEMPKSCGNCFFDTHCDNWRLRNWGAPPPDDCPLVPVPPHGRCIDASEKIRVQIYDDMTEDYHMYEMTIDDLLCQGWVEANAPTIIEAEGEGEEA